MSLLSFIVMINCEKERARLVETVKKRKAAESTTEHKREREEPRAPFRLMNHAYAVRACSIINARLIRCSSSTLKIFTKVQTTANLRNEIGMDRRKPVHVWREGMVAVRFAIHPDCRRIWHTVALLFHSYAEEYAAMPIR